MVGTTGGGFTGLYRAFQGTCFGLVLYLDYRSTCTAGGPGSAWGLARVKVTPKVLNFNIHPRLAIVTHVHVSPFQVSRLAKLDN